MAQSAARATGGGGGRVIGDYSIGKQIGSGSFSVVWHARHRVHGTDVAIKEIAIGRLNKKLQESLMSEIVILKQIHHPNIIRLHDIIEVPGKIHLVLEYCRGGDLFMYIQSHGRVPESTAKHFMQQLAAGLKVLRENHLVHRDLKPQNLLLSSGDNNSVLKIADFGFARSLQPRGLAETLCGSPLYMAPEIMQLQKYDAKADLWSVGTILYQLVTGKTPFNGNNQIQLLQNIMKATELRFPPDVRDLSSESIDLCQKLLRRNPVERLTFDEFFNHPFLCHRQLDERLRKGTLMRREDSNPLPEYSPLKSREESSPDDCLPFFLDDDSSGPDGSSSFLRTSMTCTPDSRKEVVSITMKPVDCSRGHGNTMRKRLTSGFSVDNSKSVDVNTEPAFIGIEQRPVSSHSRPLDSLELCEQEYVLVSGPPLEFSSSAIKPSVSPLKSDFRHPASLIGSRTSSPVPIVVPTTKHAGWIGSLEGQCSAPSRVLHGSLDAVDVSEQASADAMTRIKSLRHCATSIKELVNEMIDAGKHLEAFSIQLVILAVWKQALCICHTQAVSFMEGSATQDCTKSKHSINKMSTAPDFNEGLGAARVQVLEDVSAEIREEFFSEVAYADELSKFVEPGTAKMPDAMETIYQSALALGRHGAVDELMGDTESAASSYSRAVQLLFFLLVEAPSLILNPPFTLTNSDRFRLWNYINILNDRQGISRSPRMALLKIDAADQLCTSHIYKASVNPSV